GTDAAGFRRGRVEDEVVAAGLDLNIRFQWDDPWRRLQAILAPEGCSTPAAGRPDGQVVSGERRGAVAAGAGYGEGHGYTSRWSAWIDSRTNLPWDIDEASGRPNRPRKGKTQLH